MVGMPRIVFTQSVGLAVDVNHHQNARHFFHGADAIEVAGDLATLTHQLAGHLLGVGVDFTGFHQAVEFFQAAQAVTNGAEVGEDATEPSFVHEGHADFGGVLGDGVLGLTLGAHKADILARGHNLLDEALGQEQTFQGLADIDDVNLLRSPKMKRAIFGFQLVRRWPK